MLTRSLVSAALLAASAYNVEAASTLNMTASCQSSLIALIGQDFGNCANLIGLAGLFSAADSVVAPLNTWLGSICDQTCSEASLANASAIVNAGCAVDLANGNTIAEGLSVVVSNYTVIQNVFCLEEKSNQDFCLVETLTAIQNSTGTLNSTTLLDLATGGSATNLLSIFTSLKPAQICTDCVKGIFTEITPMLDETYVALGGSVLNSMCAAQGLNFTDGQLPATVEIKSQAAVAAAANGTTVASTSTAKSSASPSRGGVKIAAVVAAVAVGLAVLA